LAAVFSLLPGSILSAPEIPAVSPPEALEMIKTPGTYLVDVRTIAEYYLIGHPADAVNIPFTFWNEKTQSFELNGSFAEDIRQRFKTSDMLIFICRSGGRSLKAAEEAFQAGFSTVCHVNEGFEGDKDENGYRTVGGWKNRGLPYTYEINPDLVYRFR
jgi:rhodanese-related sulfurtransferase